MLHCVASLCPQGHASSAHLPLSFPAGRPESSVRFAQTGGEKSATLSLLCSSPALGGPGGSGLICGCPVDPDSRVYSCALQLSPPHLALDYFKACVMSTELNTTQVSLQSPGLTSSWLPPWVSTGHQRGYVQVRTGRLPSRVLVT